MKKKVWLITVAVMLFVAMVFLMFTNRPSVREEMYHMLNQVENALGEQWEKQAVTEVSNMVYSYENGKTIHYYICLTTYYEADPSDVSGLNVHAISAVIDPNDADSTRECTVSNLPAAIYLKNEKAYLCWTIIPELSCVIEYDPAAWKEEDIVRMAQSVPANQTQKTAP